MSRRRQRAFTLIELVVTMTASMTLMVVTIGMIARCMQFASAARSRTNQSMIADRLMREFRLDAHRSFAVQVDDDAEFALPDGSTIRYHADDDSVVVREQTKDSQRVAIDRFDLGSEHRIVFRSESDPRRVTVSLTTRTPEPRTVRHVTAIVARWAGNAPSETPSDTPSDTPLDTPLDQEPSP